jgi:hypothetical protein
MEWKGHAEKVRWPSTILYGRLSEGCPGRAAATRKLRPALTAPSTWRGGSVGSTGFFAAWRSARPWLRWVKVGDALIYPASTIVTSPDIAPQELARNRAARNVDHPAVPKFRSGRLGAVLVVDRRADHTILSHFFWSRPPHLAAASHRASE